MSLDWAEKVGRFPVPAIIYGLVDPRTDEVRYIGKSTTGLSRAEKHSLPAEIARARTHKTNWLASLQRRGLTPEIVILEETSKAASARREICWIADAALMGWRLTNATPGGEGRPGPRSAQFRRRMSAAAVERGGWNFDRTGLPHRAETKLKISKSLKGRRVTWGHKIAKSLRGRVRSAEHCRNISLGRRGLR